MAAQLTVMAAGNPVTNTNLINARIVAEAMRNLRGWDTGVLDNSFMSATSSSENYVRDPNNAFMWQLTASNNNNIQVGRGMATSYGFDIQSEQNYILSITPPATGIKYAFVYLEWDFTNPVEAFGRLDIWDNGANAVWTPAQDNLTTNPIGVYRMPLYRLAINTAGSITATTAWTSLGVGTWKGAYWSKISDLSTETKTARTVYNLTTGNAVEFYVGTKRVRLEI